MKSIKMFAAAAILFSVVACNSNKPAGETDGADSTGVAQVENPVNAKELLPSKAEIDSVSYLMGINFGSMIKNYNMGDLNFNELKKGINDFVNAKGNQRDTDFVKQFKINPEEMNRIISGGSEDKPGPKDTVFVHYKLTLKDGTVLEEVAPEQPSTRLTLDRVIPAWTEGLQLLGQGGKAVLYVPSKLGYGERGSNGIEPNTPLVFDIQLDSIRHFVEPVEAAK